MGEIYALLAALVWAGAVILFRKSGETITPLALNLFRVMISSVVFVGVVVVRGESLFNAAPLNDYLILIASGVIAVAVSDTLFHMCLNRVGAGVSAIVDTLYAPFTVLFAWLMLGEKLLPVQWLGMVLIVGAILVTTRVRPPRGEDHRGLIVGILLGIGAMASLGFGIVLAKPVLNRTGVIWATAVRQLGGLLVLVPVALARRDRREIWGVFKPAASWRFSVPGALLGSVLALVFWIAGMKNTTVGASAILNQTSTIYILIFASVFLHEPFTRRRLFAAAMALGGIVLVVLG